MEEGKEKESANFDEIKQSKDMLKKKLAEMLKFLVIYKKIKKNKNKKYKKKKIKK